jgi:hypothetical protein
LLLTGLPSGIAIAIMVPLEPSMGWTLMLVLVPCWLALYVGSSIPIAKIRKGLQKEHEWNVKRWQKLVARWEQLRYCPSCDSVADLATGRTASASYMGKLLRAA